jgi:catechol 2,3-dioxygenase-like lactoylglutathione lyase family enzyme
MALSAGGATAQTTAGTETQAPLTVRIQSFSVVVPDYEEARAWYTEKLGFVAVQDEPIPGGGRFLLVAPEGQSDFGIVLQKAAPASDGDDPMPDYADRIGTVVNVVLRVSDVTAYAEAIERRGVLLTSRPRQMPWGAQATFRDLYGNSFVVVGPLGGTGGR